MKNLYRFHRRGERASAIIEALFCVFFLIFFVISLLQIFDFFAAQMVTEYSAFRTVRSRIVGFNDENVHREGKLKAVAASGRMVYPIDLRKGEGSGGLFTGAVNQFYWERLAIIDYMEHRRELDYQYWSPHGSADIEKGTSSANDLKSASSTETEYKIKSSESGNTVKIQSGFEKYPWTIFLMVGKNIRRLLYGGEDTMNIKSSEVSFSAHSNLYLEN